jgi:putative transcriptional regulator
MSRHAAPEELVLDYVAGTLAEGPALALSLHLALDPAARRLADGLAALGGALIEGETPAELDAAVLDRVLGRVERVPVDPLPEVPQAGPGFEWAPPALRPHLATGARWKRRFGGFEEMALKPGGETHRVSLLRLEPGKGLPVHRHAGSEYTVVLQGGYTDSTGSYGVGDFAVGPGAEQHRPIADPGTACIALIVLEQPIVLTGRWGRWFNPLVRRGWL